MNCNCLILVDEKLAARNLRLSVAFVMPSFAIVPQIATTWLDVSKVPHGQKNKAPSVIVSHCPFCGAPVAMKEAK